MGGDEGAGASTTAEAPSATSRLQQYLAAHNISLADAPLALFLHEGMGAGLLLGVWGGCYYGQPSSRLVKPLSALWPTAAARVQSQWNTAVQSAEAKVKRWIPRAANPSRQLPAAAAELPPPQATARRC